MKIEKFISPFQEKLATVATQLLYIDSNHPTSNSNSTRREYYHLQVESLQRIAALSKKATDLFREIYNRIYKSSQNNEEDEDYDEDNEILWEVEPLVELGTNLANTVDEIYSKTLDRKKQW